jgi:hypothetical protein
MPKTRKLSVNREVLAELSPDELATVVGGNSQVCILDTRLVCVSVENCITEELTCLGCTAR